jgi:hypothetical protein
MEGVEEQMIDKDMTEKEKAKELIDKYFDLVEAQTAEQQEDNARKAALIVCDELINTGAIGSLLEDYYLQVKKEINTYT